MPYKNEEDSILNYYKNRDRLLNYQREYDKKNKERKRLQDKKRYKTKSYNLKQNIRHYSQKYHLPILLKEYGCCQLKLDDCLNKSKLQLHHKKYTKELKDCLLLCLNCHKKIHRKV